MIRITAQSEISQGALAQLAQALEREASLALDRAAARVLREVVERTPKRWFGQVRRSWQIVKEDQKRLIENPHKVMGYLEYGTANEGTGYIVPKVKKALYIPLNRRASFGWAAGQNDKHGIEYGQDYILRKRVHGIKPRRIAAGMKPFAEQALSEEMHAAVKKALKELNL